jgi:ketosteroid isomerase-like protein
MSAENVEAVKRAIEAHNRGDIDALLEDLDPEIEWHPLLQVLLRRGSDGVSGTRGRPRVPARP